MSLNAVTKSVDDGNDGGDDDDDDDMVDSSSNVGSRLSTFNPRFFSLYSTLIKTYLMHLYLGMQTHLKS